MLSPVFYGATADDGCLFRLWYHMHGTDVSELTVYLRDEGTGVLQKLWSIEGEQESAWLRHAVPVQTNHNWRLVVEALRSEGPLGDIAVDDLSFTRGCRPTPPPGNNTTPGTTVTTMTPATPTTSQQGGPCDTQTQFQCTEDRTCIPLVRIISFERHFNY